MFICLTCREVIIFESDKEQHTTVTGHSRFYIHDLTSAEEKNEELYRQFIIRPSGSEPKRKEEVVDKDELEGWANDSKQAYDYKTAHSDLRFDFII